MSARCEASAVAGNVAHGVLHRSPLRMQQGPWLGLWWPSGTHLCSTAWTRYTAQPALTHALLAVQLHQSPRCRAWLEALHCILFYLRCDHPAAQSLAIDPTQHAAAGASIQPLVLSSQRTVVCTC